MTARDRAFWLRVQRRAAQLQPELAAALLRAYAIIRASFSEAELTRLIDRGAFDLLVHQVLADDVLDRAFLPLRAKLRASVAQQIAYFARDLPKAGKIDGVLVVAFDYLNPRVIDAIRGLDSKVLTTLKSDVRETVRAFVEHGIRDGDAPRTIAREFRDVVGLAPNQAEAVRNFERALRGEPGAANPLSYQLRDRRFDAAIRSGELAPAKIDTMVAAYEKRLIAFHANTIARTAAVDAMKVGQQLSWESAVDRGIVDGDRLTKTWVSAGDDRVRDEHQAMEGETVPYDEPYSNSEDVPGESVYNCRCISRFAVGRAA